jgi:hypothetical protein
MVVRENFDAAGPPARRKRPRAEPARTSTGLNRRECPHGTERNQSNTKTVLPITAPRSTSVCA